MEREDGTGEKGGTAREIGARRWAGRRGEVKQKSTQRMSKDGMLESDVNTWK